MIEYGTLGKIASKKIAMLSTESKNLILCSMSKALIDETDSILTANQQDLAIAKEMHLSPALTERLTLTFDKIIGMSKELIEVRKLPDPIGDVIESFVSPDGLSISKVRVPLGLLMMIYESRPNVTADAAGLAVKSGNAIILKGGKEALHTNSQIAKVLIQAGHKAGLPENAIQFIDSSERSITNALLVDTEHIDAIIPRGGSALKKSISAIAKVPILMTGAGICHLYVSDSANPQMSSQIALNAKTQRPGVCNSIETLLIHKNYPYIDSLLKSLMSAGVQLKVCSKTLELLESSNKADPLLSSFSLATEEDYATEYLDLMLTVKLVDNLDEATKHIGMYSTGHSEAIITENLDEAELFLNTVDSACVYHNASTRFTDGSCFGFGAEIGIATQKLHARGPMGLRELTSYKYQIRGAGQIRA